MSTTQIKAVFQHFDAPPTDQQDGNKLASLRAAMKDNGVDIWLVPHGDEYQNEYPPKHAERLAWLTGFTGSAGFCIVTYNQAAVFSDGRYTLQLLDQVAANNFSTMDSNNVSPQKWLTNWLEKHGKNGSKIGFDPDLISIALVRKFEIIANANNAALQTTANLIDQIWEDQPRPPLEAVSLQPIEFAGELALHKISNLKNQLQKQKADYLLITDPASICWLFNIRGGDTPHTPLALGFCLFGAEDYPLLFMDKRKIPLEEEAYLSQLADLHAPASLARDIGKLAANKTFLCDPIKTSHALEHIVTSNGGTIIEQADPVILKRAIKNQQEIEGSRAAHLRDGVAVTKFLFWLDQQPAGTISEIAAVEKLETLRRDTAMAFNSKLLDISFDTISGAGENGAIVHYRVTNSTNAVLEKNSLYLVDSGGQYRDGTTDITRTFAIGKPPREAVSDFTLVLKGHIAIARAHFPKGTRGVDLDPLARVHLWQNGRDYAHGTGHGIGSYLSVHEGPQSISKRGMAELKPGMILSNEPGFYRQGKYGIRIENLILINDAQEMPGGNIAVMNFETLSIAPIDLRLIDPQMLSADEINWLNNYHTRVVQEISPHLENAEKQWLVHATRKVGEE